MKVINREYAEQCKGKFGYIVANGDVYLKAIHGRITDCDKHSLCFEDNEGNIHIFKYKNIHSFELMEFKITENIPYED